MGVRVFVYDAACIAAALEISTEKRFDIANEAVGIARGTAPVESGEYRDGIGTTREGTTVKIVDDDPEAAYKEYGTSDTPAHATLTDAARKFGRYSGIQPKGR